MNDEIKTYSEALIFMKEHESEIDVTTLIIWNNMIMNDYPDQMIIDFVNTIKHEIK